MTSIGLDRSGNIWTGHAKGLVRVRKKANWEAMVEHKYFNEQVRCIEFDAGEHAWLADDMGNIKVVRYDMAQHQLHQARTFWAGFAR